VLIKIAEKFGKSKALEGLRQAINDTIEDTQELDGESVRMIDKTLASHGIVTLSYLRKRYWSKYKRILSQKIIKNDTEYYLANGLLSDLTIDLRSDERSLLTQLVAKYENRA
jgi:hypothetical protein